MGGIWNDDEQLYIGFAGRHSEFGDDAQQPEGVWSYKPGSSGSSGTWKNLDASGSSQSGSRPFSALYASGGGAGYVLGGFAVNASEGTDDSQDIPIPGLTSFNLTTKDVVNRTTSGSAFGEGLEMGGMLYIPNFGTQGILTVVAGDKVGYSAPNSDDLVSPSEVSVYDIFSGTWYKQQTSGFVPEPRKEFCVAGVASNNETYEILVYAGWGGHLGDAALDYDEAFVLSLPAFQWFKAEYPPAAPRHGVTCAAVGGAQVLTVGGVDTLQNGPDELYNDVYNTSDPFTFGLNIFDMNKMAFASSYVAKAPEYTGAPQVKQYYASK